MALDATKWQVRSDKSIRYIGGAHGTATANYVTVLELHRDLFRTTGYGYNLTDSGAI